MVVSNIFYFHPYLGKIPIVTNIFQRGWNHQLGTFRDFFPRPKKNPSIILVSPRLWKVTLAWLVSPNEQLTQPRVSAIRRRKVGWGDGYGGMEGVEL